MEAFGLFGLALWLAIKELFEYKRRNRKPLSAPNPHPGANRLGDMSVAFFLQEIKNITDVLQRIEVILAKKGK